MINKSASLLGTVSFINGNQTVFHVGINRNTGETIVWQVCNAGRPLRVTGRNIAKLWAELGDAMNKGECKWISRSVTLCVAMPEIPRFPGDEPALRIKLLRERKS